MTLLQKILLRFNGLHYRQEYLCCCAEQFMQAPKLYWYNDDHIIKDVTAHHLFVGYHPLIIVLPFFNDIELPQTLHLLLTQQCVSPNDKLPQKDALATLCLKQIHVQQTGSSNLYYYEGITGSHHFVSAFHRGVNTIINNRYQKKEGNVFLHTNLYHQVQIAYAVPRPIALITVKDGELFNVFPTDLHGAAGKSHYIISLRSGGRALQQVLHTKKLLLSLMHPESYAVVYSLGKNHMRPMQQRSAFPLSNETSAAFQYPLPHGTQTYCELELTGSFVMGIHTLLQFKIMNRQWLPANPQTLVHIHNMYATWRYKKGLPGNYLVR
ncbi:MAG: hypothetical protein JST86_02155 [Bacteroidetes bacterium]|nr:hypothetical protein [Bacteroidota bacterium]